ncbi:MBL fold metallo-hydrolase [Paenibacillus psychroresistens]|uniref:MBL fold metallo-hydrolase n=1 Tax=Paenibacillus psychroresistens TaxID=1778678 RepID=A0A6B8RUP6_9BACL|nr:MBL fold metallo-hydrolase [Paenibacillus psychroresistens]QGQ99552.1 MBL fold metallo-hydrolase [Paenibacillus psychroresistens]
MIAYKTKNLTVFQSALFHTTSSVVETDDCVVVVDPNWLPQEVEAIRYYVEQIRKDRPLYLVFTHSDWDHIIGYSAFPSATIIASEALVNCVEKDDILQQIKDFDDRYYISRDYEIAFPRVDIVIKKDGQIVTVGGTRLTFYLAPGHTADGIFTIVEPLGIFIAGDYLSDIEFPYIYSSSVDYEETIEKFKEIMQVHPINLLIPGHGNVTTIQTDMLLRYEHSLQYIASLRESIVTGDELTLDAFVNERPFPIGMRKFHADNKALMKKELQLKNAKSPHPSDTF